MKPVRLIAFLVLLVACGSGHAKAKPPTTTTSNSTAESSSTLAESSSTTTSRPTSSTTTANSSPTTSLPPGTTTGSNGNSSVKISSFSLVGPSTVECNAATSVEMKWTTSGATAVEMDIDGGGAFTRYANGTHDEMLPLACDGNAHIYKLVATAPGVTADSTVTIQTKKL